MFIVNKDDLSISVTRGDVGYLKITAKSDGEAYTFKVGDVIRFAVCEKKNCAKVLFQKDLYVTESRASIDFVLNGDDTKFDEIISKPTDYWYEVSLNPETEPKTIIGYDTEGARVFRLYPEIVDKNEV